MPFCSQILSSPTQLAEFADLERTVAWTTPEKQARREVFGTPELARRPCTVAKLHPCNVSCILCPDELRTSVSGKPRADIALRSSGTCSKGCTPNTDVTAADYDLYPDGLLPIPAKKLADLLVLSAFMPDDKAAYYEVGWKRRVGFGGGGFRGGGG